MINILGISAASRTQGMKLPKEAYFALKELKSLIKTSSIVEGDNARDRTSVFYEDANPKSIHDTRYNVYPDSDGNLCIRMERKAKKQFSKLDIEELGVTLLAGARNFEATFKLDPYGEYLLEGKLTRQGSNFDIIEKKLSPRLATKLLKSIVADQRQRLSDLLRSNESLSLEEYFAVSLKAEFSVNGSLEAWVPRNLRHVAGDLYGSNNDVFKHSNVLGEWFRESPSDFKKKIQEASESAGPKIEAINKRLETEWLQRKIRKALQNLYPNAGSAHRAILGSVDQYENVSEIVTENATFFFANIITQDRMEKFETVPCVGRWDGALLEVLVLDDGMGEKLWKSSDLHGLSPKMVFDDLCPKLILGGTFVTGKTLKGSDLEVLMLVESEDLKGENFFDKDASNEVLKERLNFLNGLGKEIYELLRDSFPEERATPSLDVDYSQAPTFKLASSS